MYTPADKDAVMGVCLMTAPSSNNILHNWQNVADCICSCSVNKLAAHDLLPMHSPSVSRECLRVATPYQCIQEAAFLHCTPDCPRQGYAIRPRNCDATYRFDVGREGVG